MRLAFEELGPSFVKFGQLLASRPDLVPASFVNEFKNLQDNVSPIDFSEIEKVLIEELGNNYKDILVNVDPKPLAAASIAQVHTATLKNGDSVVIKVQRPGIVKTIQEDLNILYNIASLIDTYIPELRVYNPEGMVDEFFKALDLETNFIIEANNILRFQNNFASDENVYIPKVYLDYTSERLLVMEKLEGKRLSQTGALEAYNIKPEHIVEEGLRIFLNMVFRDGFFHGDLHAGNIFVLPNGKIGLVDFGVVGRLSTKARESISVILLALATEDYDQLAYEFVDISPYHGGVLIDQFAHDLRSLIAPYHGLSFKNVDLGKLLMESTTIASQYGLRIPNELLLYFKAVITVEGMGRSIIEDFDILKYTEDFSTEIIKHRYDPAKMVKNLSILSRDSADLLSSLPRQLKQILRKINSPGYSSKINLENMQELRKTIHISSNLIFLGLVISSLILASAISLNTEKVYGLLDLPFFSVVTLVSAILLAGAAFYNYIRK